MTTESTHEDSDTKQGQRPGFQVLDRMVVIVDVVRAEAPVTLAQLARATGLSEPTALRYLNSLRQHRIIRRDAATGTYSLGMRLYEWGEAAHGAYDPKKIAAPILDELSTEFGETVELAGREPDERLIVLDARPGRHGISKLARVGDVEEWHSTSVGKALLSAMPAPEARALIGKLPLPSLTVNTRTSPDDLERDLTGIRGRGFALDDEESEIGLRCVGVAARDRSGRAAFALSVSGPSYRMTDDRIPRIAEALGAAAAQLESAWGLGGHE
ncbi:IclR family transcriptional regulator [Microbacterium lushaniae]|uniref:IclR family transcriptional regulator n=1 Tax=Microbacterium lushaniae TaxID=2614639 RepID=A0A5J6L3Y0_9MICO|nr:IclR family transcriptional regulator [Microbacterium lushaniae]QEW03085.1 IclR family transcriptional regulator [Microbacterium lushaniae]